MIYFTCDYQNGAHPHILKQLQESNRTAFPGYGTDDLCRRAAETIRAAAAAPAAAVHFLAGGTQANLTVISSILRPHQAVLAAESGHIHTHEAGAVEATGHKVLPLLAKEGKITAEQVREAYCAHWENEVHEHMSQPGMVYISHPTELGTLYSKADLTALSAVCRELSLPLYLDGARLAYALAAPGNDLTLVDISQLCDVFYLGGTKCGALFGEAVVICDPALQQDFRYLMKQRGAMLAKGWLLGLQFLALLEDGLYAELGQTAIRYAQQIDAACRAKGCPLLVPTATNQVFPIFSDTQIAQLAKNYVFEAWVRVDPSHTAVRFVTSWATEEAEMAAFLSDLAAL